DRAAAERPAPLAARIDGARPELLRTYRWPVAALPPLCRMAAHHPGGHPMTHAADAAAIIRRQLAFLAELDKLKSVVRQSRLIDGSRRENSAEHSWHLAMFRACAVRARRGRG